MWKNANGKLIHVTDITREKFRTNISKAVLDQLGALAEENDTHVNYLIENGLENLLSEGFITYNKRTRPTDRAQYKTTYDKKLLASARKFAADHGLFINDIIEYSVSYINLENCKDKTHRSRIEKL